MSMRDDYIGLRIAEETDDVQTDISTIQARDAVLTGIEACVSKQTLARWEAFVQERLAGMTHYASGAPRAAA